AFLFSESCAPVPELLRYNGLEIALAVCTLFISMSDALLRQIAIAVGLVVADIALVGGAPQDAPDPIHLPLHLAVGVFTAQSHQLRADPFVSPPLIVQLKDFSDGIGLLRIDLVGALHPVIPEDVPGSVEDALFTADFLPSADSLGDLSALLLCQRCHDRQP